MRFPQLVAGAGYSEADVSARCGLLRSRRFGPTFGSDSFERFFFLSANLSLRSSHLVTGASYSEADVSARCGLLRSRRSASGDGTCTFDYGFCFVQWRNSGLAALLTSVTYKVCSLVRSLQNLNFPHCPLQKRVARCREFFLEPFNDSHSFERFFFLCINLNRIRRAPAAMVPEHLPMGFALCNGKLHALQRPQLRSHTKYAPLLPPCKT